MSRDYAYRLQDYATSLIRDDVGKEFDDRLDDWQERGDDLVLYATKALTRFQSKLDDLKKQTKEENEQSSKLAMFVVSFLGGSAVSFFAGMLQYRLAPSLFGNRTSEMRDTNKRTWDDGYRPEKDAWHRSGKGADVYTISKNAYVQREVFDPDLAKTKGKLIGHLGDQLVSGMAVDPLIRAVTPDLTDLSNAINLIPDSSDLEDLRNKLGKVWRTAKKIGKEAIKNFANTIREDHAWGDRHWDQLTKLNPKASDTQRYQFGIRQIKLMVNLQRTAWSTQDGWFYYGYQPAPLSEAQGVSAIEVELWALWIALERYEAIYGKYAEPSPLFSHAKSRSGIHIDKVVRHLIDLGVVQHDPIYEFARRGNPAKTGVQPVEIKGIEQGWNKYADLIDTESEFLSITKWAKNRKPQIFGGPLPLQSIPRGTVPLRITTQDPLPPPQPDPPRARSRAW